MENNMENQLATKIVLVVYGLGFAASKAPFLQVPILRIRIFGVSIFECPCFWDPPFW